MLEMVDKIIDRGIQDGASDVIIKKGCHPAYFLRGTVHFLTDFPIQTEDEAREENIKLRRFLSDEQCKRLDIKGSLNISFTHAKTKTRCRYTIYKEKRSLSCVIRLIPPQIRTLSDLNLPLSLAEFAEKPSGLVLVTGPTGSGKTTTITSLVGIINETMQKHIVILEDVLEYIHPAKKSFITHREVGVDSPDYYQSLMDVLRMMADVVVVGEVRSDKEMDVVLSLAESGHLVFAALHAGIGAVAAVERVVNMFPSDFKDFARYRLAQALAGIISIRLLPAKDFGVIPICEILVNKDNIKTAIKENKNIMQYMSIAGSGNQTFDSAISEAKHLLQPSASM